MRYGWGGGGEGGIMRDGVAKWEKGKTFVGEVVANLCWVWPCGRNCGYKVKSVAMYICTSSGARVQYRLSRKQFRRKQIYKESST